MSEVKPINPDESKYARELVGAKVGIVDRIKGRLASGTLRQGEVDDAINQEIDSKLPPIIEKYRGKVKDEQRYGLLKRVSDKIRSVFTVKVEKPVPIDEELSSETSSLNKSIDSEENPDLENDSYDDFNTKIKSYKNLQLSIEEILAGKYKNGIAKDMKIIELLNEHLDVFIEAGFQIKYKIAVAELEGKPLDEPILVEENNVFLIKDILDLLIKNERGLETDILKRPVQVICGRLQVNESEVEVAIANGKIGIRSLLLSQLKKVLPDLLNIGNNNDLLLNTGSLANKKEKDWVKALALMESLGQSLYSKLSVEMESSVEGIEKIDNPTKEQQLQQFADLQEKTQSIFDEVDAARGEYSKKRNTLLEALKIIEGYEAHHAKLQDSIVNRVLNKVLGEGRLEKLKQTTAKTLSELLEKNITSENLSSIGNLKQELLNENLRIEPNLVMFDVLKKRLKNKLDLLANEKGIDSYFRDLEARGLKEGIGSLTDEEIVRYILTYEVAFWTNLHVESDHEFQKQLVMFVKYQWHGEGKGWENQASKDGTEDDEWASMEGRTIMGLIKAFGLYAKVLTGDPYAEGKKENLFDALTDLRFTRESLLQVTSHPHYGPFLTKVLECYQDMASLRSGKLPEEEILLNLNKLRSNMTKEEFDLFLPRLQRQIDSDGKLKDGWKKNLLLNERLVWRIESDGQRKLVKLAADRFVKNTKGEWSFYPGEELNSNTDTILLEADSRFNYVTLSGSMGKKTKNNLIDVLIEMIMNDPERFDLKQSDVPKKEFNMFAVKAFAQFFTYAFPFLTKIYSEATMQTQTAAHPTETGEVNFYDLFSGLLGKAIQNLERYGVIDTLVWIFPYYKPFKDGIFGASGKAGRINNIQSLMVSFIEYLFGDASKKIVHRIDPNDPRRPDMFTPMDMVARGKNEQVRYHAPITTEDGRIIKNGSSSSPAKIGETLNPVEVYDWRLFILSAQALRKARELAIGDIKPGSVTMESIITEDLNPFTALIAKIVGQLKMFDLGEKIKYINPFLFHGSGRLAYAIKHEYNPHTVHRAFTNFLNKAIGNPIGEEHGEDDGTPKQVVSRGVGGGSPIEEAMQELLDDMNGKGEEFPFRDGEEEPDLVEDIATGINIFIRNIFTPGVSVAEEHPERISSLFQHITVHVSERRYKMLVKYLRNLWDFWAEEYYSRVKNLKDSFPFYDNLVLNKGLVERLPKLLQEKHEVYQSLINNFIKILVGDSEVIPPFGRPDFNKK